MTRNEFEERFEDYYVLNDLVLCQECYEELKKEYDEDN